MGMFHLFYPHGAGFLTLRLMPRRHLTLNTLTIALTAVFAAGLAAYPTNSAAQDAQDAQASVIAAERTALDRWGKGDPQGFLDVYAPEITYFDPMQERRLDGIEAMRKLLLPLTGKIKVDRYEMIGTKGPAIRRRRGTLLQPEEPCHRTRRPAPNSSVEFDRGLRPPGPPLAQRPQSLVVRPAARE